jgi:molybdenum cofactor guanylyltransferase
VGAIVLAGGKSRRMGRDKRLLPFGDTTLLKHVTSVFRTLTDRVIVVFDSLDSLTADDLPRDVAFAADRWPGTGPLGGLITGLIELEEGAHMVGACDMPFVQPDLLRVLLARVDGFDAAVPEIAGRLEPLCAVYHSRSTQKLGTILDTGRLSLREAVGTLHLLRVSESDVRAVDPHLISFQNINTVEDYVRINPP